MNSKNLGLYIAVAVLIFLAVMSEKRILVAEGLALTRGELEKGREIYSLFCEECHQRFGENLREKAWGARNRRDRNGITILIAHATHGFEGARGWMPPRGGHPELSAEEVALAVAFMVYEVRDTGSKR